MSEALACPEVLGAIPLVVTGGQLAADAPKGVDLEPVCFSNTYTVRPLSAVRNVPTLCVVPITTSEAVALALAETAGEEVDGEADELQAALSSPHRPARRRAHRSGRGDHAAGRDGS